MNFTHSNILHKSTCRNRAHRDMESIRRKKERERERDQWIYDLPFIRLFTYLPKQVILLLGKWGPFCRDSEVSGGSLCAVFFVSPLLGQTEPHISLPLLLSTSHHFLQQSRDIHKKKQLFCVSPPMYPGKASQEHILRVVSCSWEVYLYMCVVDDNNTYKTILNYEEWSSKGLLCTLIFSFPTYRKRIAVSSFRTICCPPMPIHLSKLFFPSFPLFLLSAGVQGHKLHF